MRDPHPRRSAAGIRPRALAVSDHIVSDIVADLAQQREPGREPRPSCRPDLEPLWRAAPELHRILRTSLSLEEARNRVFAYLEDTERAIFRLDNPVHILEKATVRDAVRVFKSLIGPINEKRTGFSALARLWELARAPSEDRPCAVGEGFVLEFLHLFRAIEGTSNIYRESEGVLRGIPDFLRLRGRAAAERRSAMLDELGRRVEAGFRRYPSGLDPEVVARRAVHRERILRRLGGTDEDWRDWRWHVQHVLRRAGEVADLVGLSPERHAAVSRATRARVPFGVTPYYLSLMDPEPSAGLDHAVRAQVLPPPDYVDEMMRHKVDRSETFDFMGEHDTSPVDLVTRRYPMIAILKPYNTCAQICVYCQRNWEIDEVMAPGALAPWPELERAADWIAAHPALGDILVTGGDPGVMSDAMIARLLSRLAGIDHVFRIRFGTRMPVVLPFRITEAFCDLLAEHHRPGRREVAVVTHVEHSYEITPELRDAVERLRRRGLGVYNQQVFTIENSRRFETAKLRRDLRLVGIDPYYTFNMKGKRETAEYMVPIARLLQERKEEARLLPGLDRTDEPVFNVPRLGKNHLRAWQDRRLVMILADGSRVYELHPWEKNLIPTPPYNYVDVPIHDYLERLAARGEDPRDYRTIWYYY